MNLPNGIDDKTRDFILELEALMKKYNAEIFTFMNGDTHGVQLESELGIDGCIKLIWHNGDLDLRSGHIPKKK